MPVFSASTVIKTLQPGYDLPSRHTLSGTCLEAELSHVNIQIMNELNNESNLTIGKVYYIIIV